MAKAAKGETQAPDSSSEASPTAALPGDAGGKTTAQPVIVYHKARPTSSEASVVAGAAGAPSDPALRAAPAFTGGSGSREQDQMVSMDFVTDLARFMAANYWPAGTHPQAKNRGITTAGIKWANLKYGAQMRGFAVKAGTPSSARSELLSYVLMPSMVDGLYSLYIDRFLTALERETVAQKRGRQGAERPLSGAEMQEMYGLYSTRFQGLAGAIRTYLATPGIGERVDGYQKAEAEADRAHERFLMVQDQGGDQDRAARAYQAAVIRREQARENIAAALRRGGSTKGLDTDSLVFSALWMHRRGNVMHPALERVAGILEDCSRRLTIEGGRMAGAPPPSAELARVP